MNNKFNYNELKFIQECPACHTPRKIFKASVLEEDENNRLIYLTCPYCQSSIIMLISLGIFGLNSIGLITDLLPLEVIKFKDDEDIKANDLIDLHQYLINNNLINNLSD